MTSSPELIGGIGRARLPGTSDAADVARRIGNEPTLRRAARVLLLDGGGRLLLAKWRLQSGDHLWITPGGGLGTGEDHREAALRELAEEVGLRDAELGPWVWWREHVFNWNGRPYRQRERFYLVHVGAHEVDRSGNDAQELVVLEEFRWWTLPELQASGETFAPRRLALFLVPLLAGELPRHAVDVGA